MALMQVLLCSTAYGLSLVGKHRLSAEGTLPSSHLAVSPPCEMQALPAWASDSTGVFVTTLLCHWFRCGTLLQAGGSPPLTHMSQSPSSQAWWHVKLLNNFRAAGPQFARDGTFRPSHCHACTEQATFYCLVCSAQTVFQINLQPCWRPLRKMADDQADTATAEPPPKRLKRQEITPEKLAGQIKGPVSWPKPRERGEQAAGPQGPGHRLHPGRSQCIAPLLHPLGLHLSLRLARADRSMQWSEACLSLALLPKKPRTSLWKTIMSCLLRRTLCQLLAHLRSCQTRRLRL